MRFSSLLGDRPSAAVCYKSSKSMVSKALPGVRFVIRRMSFSRRLELCQRILEIAPRLEFLQASSEFSEKVEANLLGQEIENLYLCWGLVEVEGLLIDGETVTAERLIASGPEALSKEIVAAIQAECGLTEEERKN